MTGSADVIKEYLVALGFDVDQKSFAAFKGGLQAAGLAVTAFVGATAAAVGAITAFVASEADALDATGDLADRTDNTAESLMRFSYVAKLTGSSAEIADSSIESLNRTMGEAAIGIGRGAVTFEKLGLSVRKQDGTLKSTTEMLDEIGEKIQGLSRVEQLATLSKLGLDPTLIQALTTDTSGLKAEFDAIYAALDVNLNDSAASAGEFNDSMDKLGFTVGAIRQAVAIKLMPQIKRGIDEMRKWVVANLGTIKAVAEPILRAILNIGAIFIEAARRLGSGTVVILQWFDKLNDATDGWAGYIVAAAAAWKLLNLSFLASPVGIVIAIGAAILALVDDFAAWQRGADSFFDWKPVVEWGNFVVSSFDTVIGAIIDGMTDATIAVIVAWQTVRDWFTSFFAWFAEKATTVASYIPSLPDVGSWFGGGSTRALTPSPASAAVLGGGTTAKVDQKIDIKIDGSGDPEATGRSVVRHMRGASQDAFRNFTPAVQ